MLAGRWSCHWSDEAPIAPGRGPTPRAAPPRALACRLLARARRPGVRPAHRLAGRGRRGLRGHRARDRRAVGAGAGARGRVHGPGPAGGGGGRAARAARLLRLWPACAAGGGGRGCGGARPGACARPCRRPRRTRAGNSRPTSSTRASVRTASSPASRICSTTKT